MTGIGQGKNNMADERLCNPISTQELERRWAAVRAAMPDQKLDALIVQGATSKRAGDTLGISPRTVEFHRANIMAKLSAKNVADLMRIVLSK